MDGVYLFLKGKVRTVQAKKEGYMEQTRSYMDSAKSWFYKLQQRKEDIRKVFFMKLGKYIPNWPVLLRNL